MLDTAQAAVDVYTGQIKAYIDAQRAKYDEQNGDDGYLKTFVAPDGQTLSASDWSAQDLAGLESLLAGIDATDTSFDAASAASSSATTVASLAPIYAGYQVTVGQNGSQVVIVPSLELTLCGR